MSRGQSLFTLENFKNYEEPQLGQLPIRPKIKMGLHDMKQQYNHPTLMFSFCIL
jgi:hypothetical protein